MTNFLYSPMMQDILVVLAVIITSYLHRMKPQIQQEVAQILPQPEAQITNDLLDLLDQLTGNAVQTANVQIVNRLKQHNLFTPDTAKAMKQSVIDSVLKGLGTTPESAEWIVGQLIEKHVLMQKNK